MTSAPHDQTRADSTPYIKDGLSASLSRNEVASLCMKAARGAGMSWGLAEEAGFAASWLVQHGINGPSHLYAHLNQAQGRPWSDLCPMVTPGAWEAPVGRALCPIALAVGCKKCPAFSVCPLKGVIGDYKPDDEPTKQHTEKAPGGEKRDG